MGPGELPRIYRGIGETAGGSVDGWVLRLDGRKVAVYASRKSAVRAVIRWAGRKNANRLLYIISK